MSHPKSLIIDKSTDDLLNELEASADEKSITLTEDVAYLFLRNNKLKSGQFKIKKHSLYSIYKKTVLNPVTALSFHILVKNYIESKNNVYLVNKDLSDLIEENKTNVKKETISGRRLRQFEDFLSQYDIEFGKEIYIECKALYYFFDEWSYKKKIQINYRMFNQLCSAYLDGPEYITKEPHYGTTRKFNEKITKEQITNAKEWAKKFKSTKPSKVSRAKP